jgi:bifunctional non-homologous end joining protein LigD
MAGLRSSEKIPFRVSPMLATLVPGPFHKPNWVYEEKYDGVRIMAYKEGNKLALITRNDIDRASDFPDLATAIRRLTPSTLLLDGEVVVFDQKNVSRFQLLQQRSGEAKYVVFDCLFADGRDLRSEPLTVRRQSLKNVVESGHLLLIAERLAENGLQAYRLAKRRQFEGVVAKDASSPYVGGRSRYWLKVKIRKEEEFVIGGYTEPAGSRKHFGALLLGAYRQGILRYVGKVGTGFNEKALSSLSHKIKPLVRKECPFVPPLRMKNATFLSPKLVAQISFAQWTSDGKLRQPSFLGLREDKNPLEVVLQEIR